MSDISGEIRHLTNSIINQEDFIPVIGYHSSNACIDILSNGLTKSIAVPNVASEANSK